MYFPEHPPAVELVRLNADWRLVDDGSAWTLERDDKRCHYPQTIRRLLDNAMHALCAFSVAADEDEKRRDKQINAGMIRLGLRAKPAALTAP